MFPALFLMRQQILKNFKIKNLVLMCIHIITCPILCTNLIFYEEIHHLFAKLNLQKAKLEATC